MPPRRPTRSIGRVVAMAGSVFRREVARSITHSWGRFIAIAVIAALGTGFYAGLRMTAPDMKLAADEYYDATNLADLRVVSTLGLTDNEVDELRGVAGVEAVMPAREADVVADVGASQIAVRVHSLDVDAARASDTSSGSAAVSGDASYINRPILVSGDWPSSPDECVLGADVVMDGDVQVGDKIRLIEGAQSLDSTFSAREFTVSGFVRSSYYASPTNLGTTALGNGIVEQFAYVPDGAFSADLPYTEAFLTVDGARAEHASSSAYDDAVSVVADRVRDVASQIASDRDDAVRGAAQRTVDDERAAADAQFAAAEAQIDAQAQALPAGMPEPAALAQARSQLDAQRDEASEQIADAQARVDALPASEVYTLDRAKLIGPESFESDADRVDQIAQVFPLIFFLVAALVSLTTMTRMVEEERILIGTHKALGYGKGRITSKYLVYAAVASGVGSVVGLVGLSQFLPRFIMDAYAIVYAVPPRPTPIDPPIAALSLAFGVGITVGATWLAARSTLREPPASLMQPRAPKAGKRILLERITLLWRRLSFSWKVTARNIFRYKRRFFMAVVGIAGCTALLLTGLGLQNAINDIIDKQFYEIYQYSMVARVDDSATPAAHEAVDEAIDGSGASSGRAWVATENVIATAEGKADQRLELVVPEDPGSFGDYLTMRERVGHVPLSIGQDGAVVSEKLARELGLSVGDTLALHEEDAVGDATGEPHEVRVAGIMENYVSQYAFVSPDVYEEAFGRVPADNAVYAKISPDEGARSALSDELLATDGVKTVSYNDEEIGTYRTMLQSVDSVVVVLVVAAALLAFVVLYNLTNINIAERAREIATLKVLGFTRGEVYAYIFRETMLLSVIGCLVGLALGVWMEGFVVQTAEVDQVMFGRDIHVASFAIAFLLTMLFSAFVMFAMRGKLRRIDMVESLKSNE